MDLTYTKCPLYHLKYVLVTKPPDLSGTINTSEGDCEVDGIFIIYRMCSRGERDRMISAALACDLHYFHVTKSRGDSL